MEAGQALRVQVTCARCGRSPETEGGVYVLRLTVEEDGRRVLGTLERAADGERWSFSSGRELARAIRALGHEHA